MAREFCKECGGDAVPHRLTYITVAIDEGLRPLFVPGPISRFLFSLAHALERMLTPRIFDLLRALSLATYTHAPDERTLLLAKVLWEEADKRGIQMNEVRLFNLPRNMFVARLPSGKKLAFEGMPLPLRASRQAWWLDNKAELKKRLKKLGIPVASGKSVFLKSTAHRVFRNLEAPVITKPFSGSSSRHTTLHIRDEKELMRAFSVAKEVAPFVVIEEELYGAVYRATVVDGVCVAVLRRDQPYVLGTGTHTVRELIEVANTHPARRGPYFHPIQINEDTHQELAWQGYTVDSIPEKGVRVQLNQKINWSVGGTTADVTDTVHPDTQELFERVANVLQAPIVGIDFIIPDITRSWKEQRRLGVIECNSMPFFDNHHLPFEGKPRNVAGAIWDMITPQKE